MGMSFNPAALGAGLQQAFASIGNGMIRKESDRLAFQRALDKYKYQIDHKYDNPIDRALANAQIAAMGRSGGGGGAGGPRLPNGLTPYQDAALRMQMLKLQEMINQNKSANDLRQKQFDLTQEQAYEQTIPYSDIAAGLSKVGNMDEAQSALQGVLAGYPVKDPAAMAESLAPLFYKSDGGWFNPDYLPDPSVRGKIIVKPGLPRPQKSSGKTFK